MKYFAITTSFFMHNDIIKIGKKGFYMEAIKKIFKILLSCVFVFIFVYILFMYLLFSSFNGTPMRITCSFIFGILLLITSILLPKKRKTKMLFLCFSIVCSSIGITQKLIYNYHKNIPTVSDEDYKIFNDYEPFIENSKCIQLDSTLKLTTDLPRIDGATALYPIYASIVQNVYPKDEYPYWKYFEDKPETDEQESIVVCSKTPTAYKRLIEGKTDIIFVAAPSQKQLQAAKDAGVELELIPIGKESFVFFVNANNPIDSLSSEQIKQIYSGEVTNWKELGGNDQSIRAFQRPEGSGFQSALLRFMGDTNLIEPLEEDIISGMGGIIHQTANYKNYKNSIGYSFRFYSTELVKENQIKHLAIDGIKPSKENILNNTYPITNDFYAVTLKGHTNPNINKLIEWIIAEQGQQIIDEIGYVSIHS